MASWGGIRAWFDPRRRLTAAGLIGWFTIVVVSSGARPDDDRWVGLPDLGGVLAVAMLLSALGGLLLLLFVRPNLRWQRPRRSRGAIPAFLVFAVAIVVAVRVFDLEEPPEPLTDPATAPAGTAQASEAEDSAPIDDGTTGSAVALLMVSAGVAVALVLWSRRPAASGAAVDTTPDSLADRVAAVHAATGRLLDDADPRAAVLHAYAELERSLTALAYPRQIAETASEHLRRVFSDIPDLVAPATRLGRLYEIARFSDRSITAQDRAQAGDSLEQALDRLSTSERVR